MFQSQTPNPEATFTLDWVLSEHRTNENGNIYNQPQANYLPICGSLYCGTSGIVASFRVPMNIGFSKILPKYKETLQQHYT